MIEINLLPERFKKAKKMQAVILAAGFAAILVIAGLIGFAMMKQQEIAKIQKEIRMIDAESATMQDKIEEVRRFRALEETYNKKKSIVDKLLGEQSLWTKIIDDLGALVLPDMWLNSIVQERERDEGVVVKTQGAAMSKEVVADFIKRLERTDSIMDLTAAQISDVAGGQADAVQVSFEVVFLYKKSAVGVK
ncbi:MAG TPA: hypothetical protein ENN43_07360 [bacterium]|nr:hypothetical protein [bacterium]